MVAIGSFLGSLRLWHLVNIDTGEQIDCDFETAPTRNRAASYARHTALGRKKAQTQYLHGNPDTVSYDVRVMQSHFLDGEPSEKVDLLLSWIDPNERLGRPPIVFFYVGDGDPAYGDFFATIDSIADINYDSPTALGQLRGASFTLNLVEFHEWSLESRAVGDSRYHHVKDGEYMELLAAYEYSEPLLGDVVRKRHPELQVPQIGDVVKLSPLQNINEEVVVPKSIPLKGLTARKASAQKDLRETVLERLNRSKLSAIVPEGL